MGFPDISRRQLLISGVISGLIGAGVTGSSGLNSIEGNVSVQAQQAIELTSVTTGSADSDASFTNIEDGDTSFGAAVELNNGDSTEIFIDLRNSSSAALKTRAIIKQPSPLSVSPRIADDDDLQGDNTVVQTGKDTYVFTIPAQRIVRFVLRISVPDTASPGASDVRISFDPLSTNKDEQPSTDSGPKIEDAKLFDTADGDGVVSDGETVRIEATVTEFNGLKLVTTDAAEFDPESGPVTLTDDGPGVSQSDDKFSAKFVVGENADEGTDRTVDIKATDNEGVETEETGNSLVVQNVETDNDAPTISSVSLSDETDSDGVVSTGDTVEVQTTVKDAKTAQEITKVTADASEFGVEETVTLYSSSPPSGNSGGGTRTESATFTVESDATEGTEQTVTLTVEDENGDGVDDVNAEDVSGATLEVDNDTPTISDVSLRDETDSDGVVSTGDTVEVQTTVKDAGTAQEITRVTADASDFGVEETVTLYSSSPPGGNSGGGTRTESATFTVESDATEGTGQTVTLTVEDENGDKTTEDEFGETLEVDNAAPTISNVSLSDETDSDGVVSDGDEVKIEATVKDAANAGEITEVTADASNFGAGTVELSNTDTSGSNEAGGGGERTVSKKFTVGESGTAIEGTGQTVTITATDENGDSASTTTGSLEVDNAAPTISGVTLSDGTDSDGVVSTGDTVEVQTTVKDAETAQEITKVTANASEFGAGTVTLYSSSPPSGNPDGGTRTESATFTVGPNATEGTGQTVTLTVEDENGDRVANVDAAADEFGATLEVDNDTPTISDVSLRDETDSDGVVSTGDTVEVQTTVKDAETAQEIIKVTADASDFGAGDVELSNTDTSEDNEAGGGGKRTVSETFAVGESGTATEGTGQTVTITATDENGDSASTTTGSLEVDNAASTISNISLTDQADGDGDVDPGDTVRITATVTDDVQIENVEAEASTAGSFDLDSTPVTLTDGGPGASTSDDTFGAEFNVGDNPDTGDRSVTVTVTDEAGNTKDQESNSLTVGSG